MRNRLIVSLVVAAWLPVGVAVATEDFSSYSNDTLFDMQDQTRYMSDEDRDAYRTERQSRVSSMSDEERTELRDSGSFGSGSRNMSGSEQGQGSGTRSRLRDGSGGGSGNRYGGGGGGGRR